MIKILNDEFLKILNLKGVDSYNIFNKKYIVNFSIDELTEHLTSGIGLNDEIYRYIFRLFRDNKEFVLDRLNNEIKNSCSYFYMAKETYNKLDYALNGQGFLYFISSCDRDTIMMFLNLYFLSAENVFSIYEYTNEKLEDESRFLTKKEYDEIFIGEFLDNLENIMIIK